MAEEHEEILPSLDLAKVKQQAFQVAQSLLEAANLRKGQILVLGCSTSEIQGKRIGSVGSTDVASAVLDGIHEALKGTGVHLAVQCCEHLNRSICRTRCSENTTSLKSPSCRAPGRRSHGGYRPPEVP